MMADMLRELHSEKSEDGDEEGQSVPIGEAKSETSESSKSATTEETTEALETTDKKASDTNKDDKKSSLRRTLERMPQTWSARNAILRDLSPRFDNMVNLPSGDGIETLVFNGSDIEAFETTN